MTEMPVVANRFGEAHPLVPDRSQRMHHIFLCMSGNGLDDFCDDDRYRGDIEEVKVKSPDDEESEKLKSDRLQKFSNL